MGRRLACVVMLFAAAVAARAGDWPTWRYDAARSAASPDNISTNLTLLWSRKLPAVRPAWPLEPNQRLGFDASYEPVVLGESVFLGSPNDGSVTAYDTQTGAERWKFYTEGPVRCAPACWQGKVYAGSDDGYLYCLDAQTGAVRWKFRGAPADRPDRRQLGNGHLVSLWPTRGGPVVVNGVVYFGAGIWPIFGVFLHALDAETGQVKWTNGDLNYIARVRIDHDLIYDSGLSPQGHLVVIRDRLVVPNGRSMPAGIELASGKLIYYVQGYRNGDSRVAAQGDYAFVGRSGVVDLDDFREVGSRWVHQGTNAPADGARYGRVALNEGPFLPYKLIDGCDASSAFEGGVAYGSRNGMFYAYDVAHAKSLDNEQMYDGKKIKPLKWEPPLRWQFKTPEAGQAGSGAIKAGQRLFGFAGQKVLALEDLNGQPRLAWSQSLDGTPSSLIAANNRLFVATKEGGIYCYGEGSPGKATGGKGVGDVGPDLASGRPKTEALKPVDQEPTQDAASVKAQSILKATGVKSGYCLVLGLTDGRLIDELLKQTDLTILGVDADAKQIDGLRRHFDAAGVYGSRVELFAGSPFEFAFPPYLASLMVSETSADVSSRADAARLFDSLRPYGGTLCLDLSPDARGKFQDWAKRAKLPGAAVRLEPGLALLVREGALPGSAPWTHEAADAAHTFYSPDDLVQAPLGFLWYGDENNFGQMNDYGGGVKPQVNGGRVYAIQQRTRTLFAYDAYTGRWLWKTEIGVFHARFAAMADGVYLVANGQCKVYDPETGRLLKTFTFNAAGATCAKDLRVDGEIVMVACSDKQETELSEGYWDSTTLVCLDRRTGAELWRREARNRFNNGAIAAGSNRVFCIDSVPMIKTEAWLRRTEGLTETESKVFAIDARTGKIVWTQTIPYRFGREGAIMLQARDEWLAYSAEHGIVLCGRTQLASGLDAQSGKFLWTNKSVGEAPMIIRGRTFLNQGMDAWNGVECGFVFDLFTGAQLTDHCAIHIGGCNYAVAGKHLIMVRDKMASYAELDSGKAYLLRNIRSGCSASLIPADGLLSVPNFAYGCVCNYPIQTSFALVHMPEVAAWSGATPVTMIPPTAISDRALGR